MKAEDVYKFTLDNLKQHPEIKDYGSFMQFLTDSGYEIGIESSEKIWFAVEMKLKNEQSADDKAAQIPSPEKLEKNNTAETETQAETETRVENTDIDSEDKEVNIADVKKNEHIEKTYDVVGLLLGGAAGLAIGAIISFDIIFAIEIGMFLGLIVGTKLKKKETQSIPQIKQ
jgi:hypothetical protein